MLVMLKALTGKGDIEAAIRKVELVSVPLLRQRQGPRLVDTSVMRR